MLYLFYLLTGTSRYFYAATGFAIVAGVLALAIPLWLYYGKR
jgi:hypothetical protein